MNTTLLIAALSFFDLPFRVADVEAGQNDHEQILDDLFHFQKRCPTEEYLDMQLSKNFHLNEFTRSETATKHGLNNKPNESQIDLIRLFTIEVLQPLRDKLGAVHITSGFRSEAVNEKVGGARQSAHKAEGGFVAADIQIKGVRDLDIIKTIEDLGLPVSQVILEPSWIHVSSHQILLKGPTYLKASRQSNGRMVYDCLEWED